ncbi:alkaline-phosphatase-like protein [Boletus edulis BED1]|uniref:Alkaline-phosphatase-like protein n=1 Tax=Boletus edulis BED1 TaxID=1328754 RepID=A0AAD4BYS0_BOLED|nr:alkaline-phosphatase-like protein [Boletus edulis BED1]
MLPNGDEERPLLEDEDVQVLTALAALVVLAVGGAAYFGSQQPTRSTERFSNGTHEFKRTVILISIDGLRQVISCSHSDSYPYLNSSASYLDRGLTPHLLDISKQGLRAKYMKPVFPTLTFPNHWALMTGLYVESHGIVANNFWDPVTNTEFWYNRFESMSLADWWLGEPMWETAGRAGVVTANQMWPGPPVTLSGASPTYFVPWRDKVPLQEKLDQILEWVDIGDVEKRPELILTYEPSLDQAGHATGPMSALVNEILAKIDVFARDLHHSLLSRNLSHIVDVVFVSDHGMGDTGEVEWIYLDGDDILGETWNNVTHYDGWPSFGLRFVEGTDERVVLEKLVHASNEPQFSGKFQVYITDSYAGGYLEEAMPMPPRYHFSENERIAPIWVVPTLGCALTSKKLGEKGMSIGNHGYDNEESAMQAIFVVHGPFSHGAKLYSTDTQTSAWHSVIDGTYIIPGFANVELYNLVMRLLGIEAWAAPNNGTTGFWDKYVDL